MDRSSDHRVLSLRGVGGLTALTVDKSMKVPITTSGKQWWFHSRLSSVSCYRLWSLICSFLASAIQITLIPFPFTPSYGARILNSWNVKVGTHSFAERGVEEQARKSTLPWKGLGLVEVLTVPYQSKESPYENISSAVAQLEWWFLWRRPRSGF